MRKVGMQSWRKIRDALGFKSVGAAQLEVKRYGERYPLPSADAAMAGIVERKRVTVGDSSRWPRRSGLVTPQALARLVDLITRADAELAKL